MRNIKEVLRLHKDIGLFERQIAKNCGISRSTVKDYLQRVQIAGLSWSLPVDLDDTQQIQPITAKKRGKIADYLVFRTGD